MMLMGRTGEPVTIIIYANEENDVYKRAMTRNLRNWREEINGFHRRSLIFILIKKLKN